MSSKDECTQSIKTGVQICSEVMLPGGSNLIKGDFVQAGIHVGLGLMARALLGFPGMLLVSTNSLSKALTDRHLYEHLSTTNEQQVVDAPAEETEELSNEENKKTPRRTRSPGKTTKAPRSRPAKK
jgi:Family of unknown function (DUF6072)